LASRLPISSPTKTPTGGTRAAWSSSSLACSRHGEQRPERAHPFSQGVRGHRFGRLTCLRGGGRPPNSRLVGRTEPWKALPPPKRAVPRVTRTLNERRGEPHHRRGSDNLVRTQAKDALSRIRRVTLPSSLVNATKWPVAHYSISTVVSQLTRLTPVNRGERKRA
jgi:hypothetical protein